MSPVLGSGGATPSVLGSVVSPAIQKDIQEPVEGPEKGPGAGEGSEKALGPGKGPEHRERPWSQERAGEGPGHRRSGAADGAGRVQAGAEEAPLCPQRSPKLPERGRGRAGPALLAGNK